jgi:hypothetical protein
VELVEARHELIGRDSLDLVLQERLKCREIRKDCQGRGERATAHGLGVLGDELLVRGDVDGLDDRGGLVELIVDNAEDIKVLTMIMVKRCDDGEAGARVRTIHKSDT